MDAFIGVLGAGIGAGIMAIIQSYLNHKWKKDEHNDENLAKSVKDQKVKIDALVNAQKVLMIDRIRYLGESYIAREGIYLDEKENLHEMHGSYKQLGGNGHLDVVMSEVDALHVLGRSAIKKKVSE